MRERFGILILASLLLFGAIPCQVSAQDMSLSEAVSVARKQSVEAVQARFDFVSSYWAYRSYKASLLPSLVLYGGVGNFSRMQTLMQDFDSGAVKYTWLNNMQNNLGLCVNQNISLTGGSVSLYSDLSRIDQFGSNSSLSWYSQPVTMTYTQPLFKYNSFKWNKLISPKEYERARRVYIESMEKISGNVVCAYFDLALASLCKEVSQTNYENTVEMLRIAESRLALGSIKKDECLQLELRMLNDSIAINENVVSVRQAQMALNSLLGFDESREIHPVMDDALPDLSLDYEFVIEKAHENSSFDLENDIKVLNAQSMVAEAKASRGLSMQFNARFGLSKSDRKFADAYKGLVNQEVVGLTFSVPICDWGMGKGKVQKAKAAQEVVRAQVEQSENDFRRDVFTKVGKFNNLYGQCRSSRRAKEIALDRYELMMESFRNGNSTVTELNTAQSEYDSAVQKYIRDLSDFWVSYYALRQLTLFDFIAEKDIDVNPEEMLEN